MKAFELKRLMLVALVACLPIACGSTSPMGTDVTALAVDATASALRSAPGVPPTAPEAPSPESVPVPDKGDPTNNGPVPDGTADPADTNVPNVDNGRRPNNGRRPITDPPSNDPLPEPDGDYAPVQPAQPPADTHPAPPVQPPADTVPPPPVAQPPADTVDPTKPLVVPPPPQQPDTTGDRRECLAVAAEIMILRGSLPQPLYGDSVLLQLLMLDKNGLPIKDGSCRGIAWSFDNGFAAGPTITVSADTQFATVAGLAGGYTIRAVTPNGLSATVGITVQ